MLLTRSGKAYEKKKETAIEAAIGPDHLQRATTRSGLPFRRISGGFYPSRADLQYAHFRLFDHTPTFYLIGKFLKKIFFLRKY